MTTEQEIKNILRDHENRIAALEKSRPPASEQPHIVEKKKLVGLAGGLHLLLKNGFFKQLRTGKEVHAELAREGYHHAKGAVNTALRRDLVKAQKVLNRVEDAGQWKYAERK